MCILTRVDAAKALQVC
jgi:hypothetical protein